MGVLTASCYICRTSARSRRNGRPQTISCSGCRSAVDETQRAHLHARRASCATSASLGPRLPLLCFALAPVHPSPSLPPPTAAIPCHADCACLSVSVCSGSAAKIHCYHVVIHCCIRRKEMCSAHRTRFSLMGNARRTYRDIRRSD